MNDYLLERIDEIDSALEESFGPMMMDSSAQTIEDSLKEMKESMAEAAHIAAHASIGGDKEFPWFESLLQYLLTLKGLKIIGAGIRRNESDISIRTKLLESTVYLKNSLPVSVQARIDSGLDYLPDSLKTRFPGLQAIKSTNKMPF